MDFRKITMLLYPNPVAGGIATLSLGGLKPGQFDIQVMNMAGQNVISRRLNVTGIALTKTLNFSTMKAGVYSIIVSGANFRESKTFVVH